MTTIRPQTCGTHVLPDGSLCWRVWAPNARRVELVLIRGEEHHSHEMQPEDLGYFSHVQARVPHGQLYAYRLDGGPERPDPCSRWQPLGVHRPSAVMRTDAFSWSDRDWKGIPREALVFYELHVGTFTPEGTFAAVIPRLPALRDLGVTAIEIMPVGQFPGGRNWGYDGVHPYAAQNTYGGPEGLQQLVQACHAAGLAIFLDVVYNHLGPEGNYLRDFGPYFTDRYHTGWGSALNYDDAGSYAVRDYVVENARMWLEDFHFDGLRLDAVHAIYDTGPTHILHAIKQEADAVSLRTGRTLHVIAESDLNDPKLLLPVEAGGYGLDGQWSDDFHHAVHAVLTGEQHGYYADFGSPHDIERAMQQPFVYDGMFSKHRNRSHGAKTGDLPGDRFVIAIQNHDQIGNRARGERLDVLTAPAARRLAACLMLLSPRLPLLYMGEEYGEEHPFLFFCSFEDAQLVEAVRTGRRKEFAAFAWSGEVPDPQDERTFEASRLTWSWSANPRQAGLRHLYQDLLAARRKWPPLRCFDADATAAALNHTVLTVTRRGPADSSVQIHANLSAQESVLPAAGPRERILFRSESERYGAAPAEANSTVLRPYECVVVGVADWM